MEKFLKIILHTIFNLLSTDLARCALIETAELIAKKTKNKVDDKVVEVIYTVMDSNGIKCKGDSKWRIWWQLFIS